MSDLRPEGTKITLGGNEYGLFFSMKAVDAIQDHFDRPVTDLVDILSDPRLMYRNAVCILATLINANMDRLNEDGEQRPHVDEDYIGRHLTTGMFRIARNQIYKAFADTAPESDGVCDPQKGGQRKSSPLPASSISERPFWGFLKRKSGT